MSGKVARREKWLSGKRKKGRPRRSSDVEMGSKGLTPDDWIYQRKVEGGFANSYGKPGAVLAILVISKL